jgi:hypothetical protein
MQRNNSSNNWIHNIDDSTGQAYMYNEFTGETKWVQQEEEYYYNEWTTLYDDDGNIFYYNSVSVFFKVK